MRHHTKDKGDLGVLKAQADLAEQGFTILIPLTEHANFDLVAYRDGIFIRIQVKYRSINKQGALHIPFKTSWADRNGTHEKAIDKTTLDLFCIYCPDTNECYYIDPKDYRKGLLLRIQEPKNNQKNGVHFAKHFRRVP